MSKEEAHTSVARKLVMLLLADSALMVRRRAKDLVQTNIGVLHKVADVLLEKEQIDGDEFQVRSSCTLQAEKVSR